jgi:hypothetical protein
MLRRFGRLLALVLGVAGVVACAAGGYVVWRVGERLERANEKLFAAADRGLGVVQDRLRGVQQRVAESKITRGEIEQAFWEWPKKQAKERLVMELEIEDRADRLAGQLDAADAWVESSTDSVRDARELLEALQSLDARLDPTALDWVLELLATADRGLREAKQAASEVRGFAKGDGGESQESRPHRARMLLSRVIVTVADAENHVGACVSRLSEVREEARGLKTQVARSIWLGTLTGYAILFWIAAGQLALARCGWRGCRRPAGGEPPGLTRTAAA